MWDFYRTGEPLGVTGLEVVAQVMPLAVSRRSTFLFGNFFQKSCMKMRNIWVPRIYQ